jgi:hypothetical protein
MTIAETYQNSHCPGRPSVIVDRCSDARFRRAAKLLTFLGSVGAALPLTIGIDKCRSRL